MRVQIWFELHRIPSEREKQLLGQVLTSWFMLGRLGAFNGSSLQVCLSRWRTRCSLRDVL